RKITVTQSDGSTVTLALYKNLPFLLVCKEQKNSEAGEMDVQKAIPATFTLDLGKPAVELTTMGTGGLLPADKNPGSYLFLTVADPLTRNGVVTGWLTQNRGSGTIFSGIQNGRVELKAQLEHGHLFLKPGQAATLDTLAIGYFSDARLGSEQFADAVKKQYNIKLHAPNATYCSWYAEGSGHGRAGTPASTIELSEFIVKELKAFGLGVIQIDDGWQSGPNIGGPATEFDRVSPALPYRDGIAPVARELTKDGITFGLWWLPFGRNHMQPEYQNRQDWFVKKPNGAPLRQRSFGGTCLDCTNPDVQKHLEGLARTMRGWGVTYYKMDGLSCGAGVDHYYINDGYKDDNFSSSLPLHDREKTNIEAMRLGLKTIRKGAGDDVFFSGCCAVQNMRILAGSIGLVDSMRVGPDFNHDGQGIRSGPIRGSRLYFMNGKIWWNDPDPSKVRTSGENCEGDPSINGAVTLDQARLTTSWVSLAGQFFLVSDWLPNLPQERLEVLKRTLTHHNATARPVDYFDNALANTWLVTDEKSGVRRDVIGVFNFYGTPLHVEHTCAKIGLDPARTYHAFDFWANMRLPDFAGTFKAQIAPGSCSVIAVRANEGHPVLLSTSRHVTQGIVDVTGETWSRKTLSATSALIANDPYELRIAGTADGGKGWKAVGVTLSSKDRATGVTASVQECPGLLRVTLKSPITRAVKWSVMFAEQP
ncbi:MAG: alpha-galactosidase, partial [bacterium]